MPPESFLLHVSDKELTAKVRQEKATNPCLNSLFMKRLRAFCAAKGLVVAEGEQLQRAGGGAGQGRSGKPGPAALGRALGVSLATDVHRTYRLEEAGYTTRWSEVPKAITPMNRLILAWPSR